jgi:hypothetical protein
MQRSWTKNEFWNLKWSKWCIYVPHFLINNHFGAGHWAYFCTPWTPNIEIMYFMFDWSIYRLFVLNRFWNPDSLQMMIFVCSSFNVVEQKTLYEPWITRNVVHCVHLFHLSYSLTLTTYLCSQWAPNVQFKYSMLDWSMYILFVLNRGWKRDSLKMMIFVCLFDMQRSWTKNAFWDVKNK